MVDVICIHKTRYIHINTQSFNSYHLSRIWNFAWWKYDMERFAVTPLTISKWVWVVLKRKAGFNLTFRSVAYWSKRRVETNGLLIETNGSFQNHPNSIRNSHYMVLPQTFSYLIIYIVLYLSSVHVLHLSLVLGRCHKHCIRYNGMRKLVYPLNVLLHVGCVKWVYWAL